MGFDSVGIDLGASTIHVVVLGDARDGDHPSVVDARTFDAADLDGVVALVEGAAAIAIDAPSQLSTARHRDDASLSPKFRVARCGEIALGTDARIWVPWVTPADATKVPAWMQVGFALWSALRVAKHEPLEVYPAGVFRVLAGVVPPRKTTRAGHAARVTLLAEHVALPPLIEMWSHDGVDALGAALVAHQQVIGRARELGHDEPGCDPTGIWLPVAPHPA
jgi:Protein of unknown function (DUF429)